ncbi:MAG: hypothetical protein Q9224_007485, partial [Gallowayella concinna]
MASRKYNEFLDNGSSDDEVSGSHYSEDAHERKGRGTTGSGNRSKRQKIGHESSDDGSDNNDGEFSEPEKTVTAIPSESNKMTSTSTTIDGEISAGNAPSPPQSTITKHSKSVPESTTSTRPSKPGVVYLSRIPPFMRPSTVRHLLTSFGVITRIFLTPEPPAQHTSRVRSGGNKKRSFIDGWIEFASHKSAKT